MDLTLGQAAAVAGALTVVLGLIFFIVGKFKASSEKSAADALKDHCISNGGDVKLAIDKARAERETVEIADRAQMFKAIESLRAEFGVRLGAMSVEFNRALDQLRIDLTSRYDAVELKTSKLNEQLFKMLMDGNKGNA